MTRSLAGSRRAEATALPSWIKPQLTKLVDRPPDGPEWLHEIKFDGYQMHARLDRGTVRFLTRTGLDWTHKYPAIAAAVASLPAREAYLDGELCGVRSDGTTSFSLIQNASDTRERGRVGRRRASVKRMAWSLNTAKGRCNRADISA
jgi:ATP-dependent DNA ligase